MPFESRERYRKAEIRCGQFRVWDFETKSEKFYDQVTGRIIALGKGHDEGNKAAGVAPSDTLDIKLLDTIPNEQGELPLMILRVRLPSSFCRSFAKYVNSINHGDKISVKTWPGSDNKKVSNCKVLLWKEDTVPTDCPAEMWAEALTFEQRNALALERFMAKKDLWETPTSDTHSAEEEVPGEEAPEPAHVAATPVKSDKPRPVPIMRTIHGEEFDVATNNEQDKKIPVTANTSTLNAIVKLFTNVAEPIAICLVRKICFDIDYPCEQATKLDQLTLYQAKIIGRFASSCPGAWRGLLEWAAGQMETDPFADE